MDKTITHKRRSLDALTGWRFIAAFVVLISHTLNASCPGQFQTGHYATNAVSFFFVLSGLILTYVYFDRLTKETVLSFFRARWARIWPLHIACLALGILAWWWTEHTAELSSLLIRLSTYFTLTQSWVPIRGWSHIFNGPSWSVSTELGFYVVFPMLLWLGRKRFWPVFLIVIAVSVGAVCLAQFYFQPSAGAATARYLLYVHPISRLFDFMIGMMFGKIFLSRARNETTESSQPTTPPRGKFVRDTLLELAVVGAVLLSLYLFFKTGPIANMLPSGNNMLKHWLERGAGSALVYATLLLVFGSTNGMLGKVLSSATAVYLGEISYALYLVQNPVMLVVKNLPATPYTSPVLTLIALNLICFGMAVLLHHWIENPFRRFIIAGSRSERWQVIKGLTHFSGRWYGNRLSIVGVVGLLIAVSGLFVNHRLISPSQRASDEVTQWMVEVGTKVKPSIKFADEAILKAYNIDRKNDSVDITLAWEILPKQQRVRIFHIVDQDGNIVRQKVAAGKEFAKRGIILDRCSIPISELPRGYRVGIVFFGRGKGCAIANRGLRSMGNRRLEFFTWNGKNGEIVNHLKDKSPSRQRKKDRKHANPAL